MRIGIIGTGAIARKNAQAYKNIGFQVTACTNTTESRGRTFALSDKTRQVLRGLARPVDVIVFMFNSRN